MTLVETGESVDVLTYQVVKESLSSESDDNMPSKVYKGVMLEGAREQSMPEFYIKK